VKKANRTLAVKSTILKVRATVLYAFCQPELFRLLRRPIDLNRLFDRYRRVCGAMNYEEWARRQQRNVSHWLDITAAIAA